MAPRTCSCAAYDHRTANQDQRDHGQNPANDNERLKFPIGGLQPRVKRHKPGDKRQQRKIAAATARAATADIRTTTPLIWSTASFAFSSSLSLEAASV
jgi:uncharacterized protein involved in type VI secretion and phage assembly